MVMLLFLWVIKFLASKFLMKNCNKICNHTREDFPGSCVERIHSRTVFGDLDNKNMSKYCYIVMGLTSLPLVRHFSENAAHILEVAHLREERVIKRFKIFANTLLMDDILFHVQFMFDIPFVMFRFKDTVHFWNRQYVSNDLIIKAIAAVVWQKITSASHTCKLCKTV